MSEATRPTAQATLQRRSVLCASLACALPMGAAWAQSVGVTKLIVPYTPGASNDLVARLFADAMAKRTGGTWIVENKPGAGSMLGAEHVAKASPDGLTLLLCAPANMGILPAIRKTMRYDVERDFSFIGRIASSPFGLAVNTAMPATNFAEFIQLAKSKPGAIRIGAAGMGSLDYMGSSLLQAQLGIKLQIIPYKGMSPVLNDLRAGHIDASIVSPATALPLIKEGHVRMLAVLDKQRSELLPNVPSSADLGQPRLHVLNWWGIAAPAKLPPATTHTLRQHMQAVLADPTFMKALQDKGFEPSALMGDAFAQFVGAELGAWKQIARQDNISLDE
jgi:tripartite-type tricarboxylate transporter receptor subunit TctC